MVACDDQFNDHFWHGGGGGPQCLTSKYPIQIHTYTNTACGIVPDRPNICYIFGKPFVQGLKNEDLKLGICICN